ncbi:MAG: ATP-binding cassette domain-containing protein [Chloroflexota bacterium]
MTAGPPYVVQTRGLARHFGDNQAVRSVDLAVRQGEVYGFLGPNGAGKSTTISMLLGLTPPTAGTIELFGEPGPADPFRHRPRMGVVGEQQYLYDDLSAWEYLMLFARLFGVERPAMRAQELLERFDLYAFHRVRARDFSRGMQQKLGLARALLHRPELLVLDEPVSGLDPHGIRQVREVLAEENRAGTTIIVSSHVLSEVERTAHRVGILAHGRLIAEGDLATLTSRIDTASTVRIEAEQLSPAVRAQISELPFVRSVALADANGTRSRLTIQVDSADDRRRELSAIITAGGGIITSISHDRPGLEDVFVQLTSEATDTPPRPATTPESLATPASVIPPRSPLAAPAAQRRRTIGLLARHDATATLTGITPYVVVALGALAAVPPAMSYSDAIQRSGVLVLANPFTLPFFVASTLTMLYLALSSATSIARDRETGTLEVLFYGPVDAASYVTSRLVGQMLVAIPMLAALAILYAAHASMTSLRLGPTFPLQLVLSFAVAGAVAALGICISSAFRAVRPAVAALAGLAVILLALRAGSELLGGIQVSNNFSPLLWAREVIVRLDALIAYVSPFSVLQDGVDAIVRTDFGAIVAAFILAILECALLTALAIRLLARRGARR